MGLGQKNDKIKKPGVFKRWLYRMLKDHREYLNANNVPNIGPSVPTDCVHNDLDSQAMLNFRVHFADGGRVVQMNYYDKRTEQFYNRLYIVTDDKEFGKELDKIITMEGLRQ